jgi:hypothetical protein
MELNMRVITEKLVTKFQTKETIFERSI